MFSSLAWLEYRAGSELSKLEHPIEVNSDLSIVFNTIAQVFIALDSTRDISFFISPEFSDLKRTAVEKLHRLQPVLQSTPQELAVVNDMLRHYEMLTKFESVLETQFMNAGSINDLPSAWQQQIIPLFDTLIAMSSLMEFELSTAKAMLRNWLHTHDLYGNVLKFGAGTELLLIAGCLLWFRRHVAQRFGIVIDNSYKLASNKPLNAPLSGNDEIAEIDHAFHGMAAKLTETEKIEAIIAENTRALMCAINEKLSFVDANQASINVLGYEPAELLHMRLARLFTPADMQAVTENFERIKTGRVSVFEMRCLRHDGKPIETSWSVRWSVREQLFFCTVHDNTDRKRAERLRKRVAALVSNELQVPLAKIEAVLREIRSGAAGELFERGRELLPRAEFATAQMSTLVKDLLDLESIESGGIELKRSQQSLASLAEQALYGVSGASNTYGVTVATEGIDIEVFADRDRLVQVLVNLLSNAVKFSPPGSSVLLQASQTADMTQINVTDKGRGIPAHVLPELFQRFRQSEISDAKEKGGTGLGLSISKALVELHGGKISVRSEEGKGTTFTIRLPRSQVQGSTRLAPP